MTHTTPTLDILIILTSSALTTLLAHHSKRLLVHRVPGWDKLPTHIQSRLAMEVASVPARIALSIVISPIIWTGFRSLDEWRERDTEICLIIWYVPLSASPSHNHPLPAY
jgi:hypothetical protein